MTKKISPGFAIWLTGLPASGKTSLAQALSRLLAEREQPVQVLDSDELRRRLTPHPTYSPEERDLFYDLLGVIAELLTANGVNVLIAATGSQRAYRQAVRDRLDRFAEVYLDCPPQVCRARDPEGLWRRAERGEISNLPGADAPYEPPESPEVRIDTARLPADSAAQQVLEQLAAQDFFR